MGYSKWVKTNSSEIVRASRYTNRAIPTTHPTIFYAVAAISAMGAYWQILQTDFSGLALPFGIVIAIGAFAFVRHLLNVDTYNLRRSLKLPYDVAEPALHTVLSDMNVAFTRKINTSLKTHTYEISGHDIVVRITPYDMVLGVEHGRDDVSQRMMIDSLGVLITLYNVSDENAAFAKQLTAQIDAVATAQPTSAFA